MKKFHSYRFPFLSSFSQFNFKYHFFQHLDRKKDTGCLRYPFSFLKQHALSAIILLSQIENYTGWHRNRLHVTVLRDFPAQQYPHLSSPGSYCLPGSLWQSPVSASALRRHCFLPGKSGCHSHPLFLRFFLSILFYIII